MQPLATSSIYLFSGARYKARVAGQAPDADVWDVGDIRTQEVQMTTVDHYVALEQLEKIRACHSKVEKSKQLGHEPIYIDEVMFTSSTNMESTWSPKYSPIMLDRKKADTKPIACIAAISARNGIELVMQFDFSVDKKKFESFLIKLREKMG